MSYRNYTFICEQCQEPFEAKRKDAKYCSGMCRKRTFDEGVSGVSAEDEQEEEDYSQDFPEDY